MSLPNYSPSGKILFGSVPWDNNYSNVRLYTNLTDQYNDIASCMTLSSEGYKYIGRNRTLDVAIEADRMYHCNYCMYRNNSLTDGWIYCFITDVQYINDHTSRVTLETDVFQTYLYNVDWTIPPCFVDRETVPSEDTKYLLTSEPQTSLIYTVTDMTEKKFEPQGVIIVTANIAEKNSNVIEDILNPDGYYAEPAQISIYKGIVKGANYYYASYGGSYVSEKIEQFLNQLTFAGAIDSVVSIFTVPKDITFGLKSGLNGENSGPNAENVNQGVINLPARGNTVDGYTPRNSKLLYYPYTYCHITDYQGSVSDLLYEQFDDTPRLIFKYVANEECSILALPDRYMGVNHNLDYGFATSCGAQCSWISDTYRTWINQNSVGIMTDVASIVGDVAAAASGLGAANAALSMTTTGKHMASSAWGAHTTNSQLRSFAESEAAQGISSAGSALGKAGDLAAQITYMSKQPDHVKGKTSINLMAATGMQGVRAQRMQVRSDIAQQIDKFFDRWGYTVDRIETVNITSRNYWNYVKTGGAAAKSYNTGAGSSAPFTRGRGTPAAALAVINSAFDSGVTFWHTTSNFGNFSLDNSL